MKIERQPLMKFEDLEFDHETQLIKANFWNLSGEHRTVYTELQDFEQWVGKMDYLRVDQDNFNPLTGNHANSYIKISMEDLLLDCSYCDYRNRLAEDYFKELLNIAQLTENNRNRQLIERLKKQVQAITRELENNFKKSA